MEANWTGPASTTRPQINGEQKQGHSGTRKVRVVCKKCNGTWMSRLEEDVKLLLEDLITSNLINLDKPEQKLFARWIAKTSITAEHIRRRGLRIPEEDRQWIMDQDSPPDLWSIWIAPYEGVRWSNLRIGQYTGTVEIPVIGAEQVNGDYLKATSLGAGRLFGLCVACRMPVSEPPTLLAPITGRMHRIWPLSVRRIQWPSFPFFSDADADAAAFVLTHPIRVVA
jgi:hypothetical protein